MRTFILSKNILLLLVTVATLLLTGCEEGAFPMEELRQQSLSTITNYAQNPDTAKAPDVDTYHTLDIQSVTPSNIQDVNLLIARIGKDKVDTKEELKEVIAKREKALALIMAYASDSTHAPAPTLETYRDLSITGINETNLDAINKIVAGLTPEDVDTIRELLAIVDGHRPVAPNPTPTPTPPNHAPTADNQTVTTTEDTAKTITLTGHDTDDDNLHYTLTKQPLHGSLSGTAPSLIYTPHANFNGADTFTFKVNDGTVDSGEATVRISVTAVNDAPTVDAGENQSIVENGSAALQCSGSDIEGSVTYTWLDGTTELTHSQSYTTPTTLGVGKHTYTCRVTDNEGATVSDTVDVVVLELLENLLHVTNDRGTEKRIKILGMGSGGSHHLIFHHSDGKTVIECGDMGAMSISHDGGKSFQQIVSPVHTKDIDGVKQPNVPKLFSIVEHPKNPNWLLGVGQSGLIAFSIDRGNTWHTKDMGGNITNKIVLRNEGDRIIAYYAAGYKLGSNKNVYCDLGSWVDITDIPSNITTFVKGQQFDYIRYNKANPTGPKGKKDKKGKYYGDIVRLGTADDNTLFVAGKGGLWVCEGDPKNDDDWRNITDSIIAHKEGVYPIDNAISIGDKLYVLAFGDPADTNGTAGVYVYTKGDIVNGKYNFKRLTKGLNLDWFNTGTKFSRYSGALLEHKDTTDGKTYLYLFTQDIVYRLNITDNSDTFERVTPGVTIDGTTYSEGYMLGKRNTEHWSTDDGGSYAPYDKANIEKLGEVHTMPFGLSVNPTVTGLNTVHSVNGKIYISNIIEVKVSNDNGKTFHSYTSKIASTGSKYDGMIKDYYGYMGLYKDAIKKSTNTTPISPTDDAKSFWWSSVSNRGMDNMVSTSVAINPDNPKEMIQTYMDYAAYFSDDAGETWHYTPGLKGIIGDAYWAQWINGNFYAQDQYGIYRFDKDHLEFKQLDGTEQEYMNMTLSETVRVRSYYDNSSDTLVVAGISYLNNQTHNSIFVFRHFTDDSLREMTHIKDSRSSSDVGAFKVASRSFKDVYCDGEYVYAINAEFGIIKMPLNHLPQNYNNFAYGLDTDEYVFSGLFDTAGNAMLATAIIEKLDSTDALAVQKDYSLKYSKLWQRGRQAFRLKHINLKDLTAQTVIAKGAGLTIDGRTGVASDTMLTLLGIDPNNKDRVLASISNTQSVIESKDGGKTWKEFIPAISGNAHGNQMGNVLFAPSNSVYDVIILGTGSTYGVLK